MLGVVCSRLSGENIAERTGNRLSSQVERRAGAAFRVVFQDIHLGNSTLPKVGTQNQDSAQCLVSFGVEYVDLVGEDSFRESSRSRQVCQSPCILKLQTNCDRISSALH